MLYARSVGLALALSVSSLGCSPSPEVHETYPPLPTPEESVDAHAIEIQGDAECHTDVTSALDLLEQKAPTDYVMSLGAIGVIECVALGSGMEAYGEPPRFKLGDVTRQYSVTWLAGSIVHDANHSRLYHDYEASNPGVPVPDSAWSGARAESVCLQEQIEAMEAIGAPDAEIAMIKNALETKYWEVPVDQRSW